MSAALQQPPPMSVDEFVAWSEHASGRWQLINGEPRAMAPANLNHAYLQAELGALIRNHLRAQNSPCDVFANPGVIPATMSARNMRVPDLMVSCVPFVPTQVAAREPVLLVEILSPGNRPDTWANVWAYTTIPSVRDILILSADRIAAELLTRMPDGSWPAQPTRVETGELSLPSIGLALPIASLYDRARLA